MNSFLHTSLDNSSARNRLNQSVQNPMKANQSSFNKTGTIKSNTRQGKYLRSNKLSSKGIAQENSNRKVAMTVYRGPFAINCLTNKDFAWVLPAMTRAMESLKIQYTRVSSHDHSPTNGS